MKENNAMTSQCPQNGRSMIEMLGVLAIIGVLSVGGIMGYSKAMFRYKINKTIEQITYIAGNVRSLFKGDYTDVKRSNIWKKAHLFPDDMWKEGERDPQNVWDGEVWLKNISKNSADTNRNKSFFIGYDNIPEEACIDLITHDWKNAQVNAMGATTGPNFPIFAPPAKLDDAVEFCSGEQNSLYFYFEVDTASEPWTSYLDGTKQMH